MTGERHTHQGAARGQRHGTLDGPDQYDAPDDWGSHAATNAREKARGPEVDTLAKRLNPAHPYGMTGAPLPCRLCQPGQRCAFHEDDPA